MLGWTGDNGDPDNFLATLLGCDAVGGTNRAQWCNEEFDALVQKAKATTDRPSAPSSTKRRRSSSRSEAPWATLAHSLAYHADAQEGRRASCMSPLGDFTFDTRRHRRVMSER